MKDTKSLIRILELCENIDINAAYIYERFAEQCKGKTKNFWLKMMAEEQRHIEHWRFLLEMAKEGTLPQIFDNPEDILADLENITKRVKDLIQEAEKLTIPSRMYYISHCMEFYVLHTAFERMLRFVNKLSNNKSAAEDYDNHINYFLNHFKECENVPPEMTLLVDAISRLWKENKRLTQMSEEDPLTGVSNRRGFFRILTPLARLAFREQNQVAVMMLDIDSFKNINDTQGHLAGDEILKMVSENAKRRIRSSDIIGRYGGDEFIIFFPHIAPKALPKICDEIREAVSKSSPKNLDVTISIGVVYGKLVKDPEAEVYEMIRRADKNLYAAKNTGKNLCNIEAIN